MSSSPNGPPDGVGDESHVRPTAEDPADLGGAIDASTEIEDGRLWLLWKADGNCPGVVLVRCGAGRGGAGGDR